MRKNYEIVLDALLKRIPVKLANRIFVFLDDGTYLMIATRDTKTGKKSIKFLRTNITLNFLVEESEKLSEGEICNLVLNLVQAKEYMERYEELPQVFYCAEYEQELLNAL